MDDTAKVLEILKAAGEPMRPGDVAEKSGLDRKIVDKSIKTLKDQGLIDSPKKCFYAVK